MKIKNKAQKAGQIAALSNDLERKFALFIVWKTFVPLTLSQNLMVHDTEFKQDRGTLDIN